MRTLAPSRVWSAWAFFGLAVVLIVGWPIAAIVNWSDIVDSHARLGYLVGDLGLVVPLALASWIGLRRGRPWAPPILLLAIGATAYDAIHFFIYLAQLEFLSIPWPVYIAILALSLAALTFLAVLELRLQLGE
jgi:hypothetical protein